MTTTAKIQRIPCDFSDRNLYNPKYIELFEEKSRFLHLFGSAGSGKSVFGCQREIVESFEWKRRKRKTLVIRKVATTLKDSVYSELNGVIGDWNLENHFIVLKSPLSITNKLTGVEFIFKGLDDPEKIKSVKGVDRILIEEATEIDSRDDLDQLNLRLRGFSEVQITLMYNPINIFHWLNTEFHEKKADGHRIFKTTYKDNKKMLAKDPNYENTIQEFKETNPNYYKIYVLGEWGQNPEGLIYADYGKVDGFPQKEIAPGVFEDDIDFYGLDFGFTDPTALIAGKIIDVYGQKKKDYLVKEMLYKSSLDAEDLIEEFTQIGVRKDIPIVADSARPEMIKALRKAGYWVVETIKFAGSVVSDINEVRKYNLRIRIGDKNSFKEIGNYLKQKKNGEWVDDPVDKLNHLMDALRYGLQAVSNISPPIPEQKSRVLKRRF